MLRLSTCSNRSCWWPSSSIDEMLLLTKPICRKVRWTMRIEQYTVDVHTSQSQVWTTSAATREIMEYSFRGAIAQAVWVPKWVHGRLQKRKQFADSLNIFTAETVKNRKKCCIIHFLIIDRYVSRWDGKRHFWSLAPQLMRTYPMAATPPEHPLQNVA